MFDLSVFDTVTAADKGATVHLKHPLTGEPVYIDKEKTKPITITVKGMDSTQFENEIQRRARLSKGKKDNDVDIEKAKRDFAELYAKLTLSWENIFLPGEKKPLEFNKENAIKLYMQFKDIRVQVGDFVADKANFIKG